MCSNLFLFFILHVSRTIVLHLNSIYFLIQILILLLLLRWLRSVCAHTNHKVIKAVCLSAFVTYTHTLTHDITVRWSHMNWTSPPKEMNRHSTQSSSSVATTKIYRIVEITQCWLNYKEQLRIVWTITNGKNYIQYEIHVCYIGVQHADKFGSVFCILACETVVVKWTTNIRCERATYSNSNTYLFIYYNIFRLGPPANAAIQTNI